MEKEKVKICRARRRQRVCSGQVCSAGARLIVEESIAERFVDELVRRAEAGEEITITVSGRPAARLVPIGPARWRTWSEVADLFAGEGDPEWERTRDLVDDTIRDPWATR